MVFGCSIWLGLVMTMNDSSLIFLYFIVHFEKGKAAPWWRGKTEFLLSCGVVSGFFEGLGHHPLLQQICFENLI